MLAKIEEGPRVGAYLFTKETVSNLDEYLSEVQHLPYKDGAVQGIYKEYIYSLGWMIPDGMIGALPAWMKKGYLGQAIWQRFGLVLTLLTGGILLWPLLRYYVVRKKKEGRELACRLVTLSESICTTKDAVWRSVKYVTVLGGGLMKEYLDVSKKPHRPRKKPKKTAPSGTSFHFNESHSPLFTTGIPVPLE